MKKIKQTVSKVYKGASYSFEMQITCEVRPWLLIDIQFFLKKTLTKDPKWRLHEILYVI